MNEPILTWQELRDRWQKDDEALCRMVLGYKIPLLTRNSGRPIPQGDVAGYLRDEIRVRLQDVINLENCLQHWAQSWRHFAQRMGADPDKGFFTWPELAERWQKPDFLLAQLMAKHKVRVWTNTDRGPVTIDPRFQRDKCSLKVWMPRILELEYRSWLRESRRRAGFVEDVQGYGGSSGYTAPEIPPRAPAGEDEIMEEAPEQANSERTRDQVKAELRARAQEAVNANPQLTIPAFMETPRAKKITLGYDRSLKRYESWLVGIFPGKGRPRKTAPEKSPANPLAATRPQLITGKLGHPD